MHLLYLSSVNPDFGHARAAQTVFAALLEATAQVGHRASFATVGAANPASPETMSRLDAAGVRNLGDFSEETEADPTASRIRPRRWATYAAEMIDPALGEDFPSFRDPERSAARLRQSGADAAVLFWDTWFEHLLPAIDAPAVFGYVARPRTEAPLARLDAAPGLRAIVDRRRLVGQRSRHLARMRRLRGAANICARDAAWYRAHGVPCSYISNFWPDPFGREWCERRRRDEVNREGIEILGNIGGLDATGNRFGLQYLADEIMPRLGARPSAVPWRINVCGRGRLPQTLTRALDQPRIALRGFVPDIDAEVAGNHIFLLCNNAGPYTGGYTRVAFAMAAGSCLVAHRRLAESMPELVDHENCLLGETPEEIVDRLAAAIDDATLRARIGKSARATYEASFTPFSVARRLAALVEGAMSLV